MDCVTCHTYDALRCRCGRIELELDAQSVPLLMGRIQELEAHLKQAIADAREGGRLTGLAAKALKRLEDRAEAAEKELAESACSHKSLRTELATIFGPVKEHHGMSWNACMLARIGEELAKSEAAEKKVRVLEGLVKWASGLAELAPASRKVLKQYATNPGDSS